MGRINVFSKWRLLELNKASGHPDSGEMVVIRKIPLKSKHGYAYDSEERYDVGMFKDDREKDPKSRKLWWHGAGGGFDDPTRMKKRYEIWWCKLPKFDGY